MHALVIYVNTLANAQNTEYYYVTDFKRTCM